MEIGTCLVDSCEVGFCFDYDCVSLVVSESCLEQVYQRCYLQLTFPLDYMIGLHLDQHDPCHDHDHGLAPFLGPCSGLGSSLDCGCVDNLLCPRHESLYRWIDCFCCGDYGFEYGWVHLRKSVSSRNARAMHLQIVVHYAYHLLSEHLYRGDGNLSDRDEVAQSEAISHSVDLVHLNSSLLIHGDDDDVQGGGLLETRLEDHRNLTCSAVGSGLGGGRVPHDGSLYLGHSCHCVRPKLSSKSD